MTPSQMVRAPQPEEPPSPPAPPRYTSDTIEDDFSIGVDLLMSTPRFLRFLQDADDHFGILGGKAREDLDKHIDLVEEFTGQWHNDEEVF